MKSQEEIRKSNVAKRKALNEYQLDELEKIIAQRVISTTQFQKAKAIATYIPINGEVGTYLLIEQAWQRNKEIYLPVLFTSKYQPLKFAKFVPGAKLILNRYGIPEPDICPAKYKTAKQMNLMLIPVVAFDPECKRIGMGGGYYDRALAFKKLRQANIRPHLLGLAYEFQKIESIKANSWDMALNMIVTDSFHYD